MSKHLSLPPIRGDSWLCKNTLRGKTIKAGREKVFWASCGYYLNRRLRLAVGGRERMVYRVEILHHETLQPLNLD